MTETKGKADERPYPPGKSTPARLYRWLVDNETDPHIRDDEETEDGKDDPAGQGAQPVTMTGRELHRLIAEVAEQFYWYGVDDVRERHGIR